MNAEVTIHFHLDDVPDGQSRGFAPPGQRQHSVFVVRRGARLHAWRDACPHQAGARMAWREHAYLNADGSRIVCSAHGALFSIDSGACLLGPCLGERLTPVAVEIGGDGQVLLRDNIAPLTETSTT